eukprot:gnl/Chilomastix_caulleri/4938.p1 GENE.gnl/Chilomastix_caulleri/4938~~gnl/Chilomastix_caulleri/4938.p1  ORF type:complete len:89 (-),score=47.85 gnl/Chilomastix_caulleri/4938:66-332(-)
MAVNGDVEDNGTYILTEGNKKLNEATQDNIFSSERNLTKRVKTEAKKEEENDTKNEDDDDNDIDNDSDSDEASDGIDFRKEFNSFESQ